MKFAMIAMHTGGYTGGWYVIRTLVETRFAIDLRYFQIVSILSFGALQDGSREDANDNSLNIAGKSSSY